MLVERAISKGIDFTEIIDQFPNEKQEDKISFSSLWST